MDISMLANKLLTTIILTLLAALAPAIPTIATSDIDPGPDLPALPRTRNAGPSPARTTAAATGPSANKHA
jgi:hypothetical protein